MDRRAFLLGGGAIAATHRRGAVAATPSADTPQFSTQDAAWQSCYDKALAVLAANVQTLPRYAQPVLIEGAAYQGIWLECGPHESLVYRRFRPDVARHSHLCFFELQQPDGQIPCNNKTSGMGLGQIQMVVPIAATAWELAQATGDDELLHKAYEACAKWDAWLLRYRNLRGTGLTEGFCTYDTGQDNSPRWQGIPPQCPDRDAKKFVTGLKLPRLCPDLSATTYGARVALAKMAAALGKSADAARWQQQAGTLRGLILRRLYDPDDAAFYDVDAEGNFVRIRCDILSRVCGEHVMDQPTFETVWSRQLHEPHAFWAPLPLPSVALDDPAFVRPIPQNSWGGASQALTALRTGRWFDAYGKSAAHAVLMQRWCEALIRDGNFGQQADPLDGRFTAGQPAGYSPAALVMMDFTWRLAGVCESDGQLQWNLRPGHAAARGARFSLRTDARRRAQLAYEARGAELRLDGRLLARVAGGAARVVTGASGQLLELVGMDEHPQQVRVQLPDGSTRMFALDPDARLRLD
ncbi:MAG TPA: hypothetical protein VMH77_00530 [Steroidobacteraceae bacterium]|nr:hypothetical protein [Steroidobacteraceae bacterium]